ncbi:hypothetical protein [Maridesulfovibrio zosterae]|uniref:hypothetical protein n=1 Tax=Maridesulfovibrio zosterae TaxID=82171 RepID=UPI0012ECB330|nr:hypothetical protein [Maridesulfovibrio zosterae]
MLKSCREKISDFASIIVGLPSFIRLVMNSEPEGKVEFEKTAKVVCKILIEFDSLEKAYAQAQKRYVLRAMTRINTLAKKTLLTDGFIFHLILSENKMVSIYPSFVTVEGRNYYEPAINGFAKDRLARGNFPKEIFVSNSFLGGRSFYEKRRVLLFRPVLEVFICTQLFLNEYRKDRVVKKEFVNKLLTFRKALNSCAYSGPSSLEDIVHFLNRRREVQRQSSTISTALAHDFFGQKTEDSETPLQDELLDFIDELQRERADFNLINIYLAIAIHNLLESTQAPFGKYDELWELMGNHFKRDNPYLTRIPGGNKITIFITGDVLSHKGLSDIVSKDSSIQKVSFKKNNGPIIKAILPKIKEFCEDKKIRNIPIIP